MLIFGGWILLPRGATFPLCVHNFATSRVRIVFAAPLASCSCFLTRERSPLGATLRNVSRPSMPKYFLYIVAARAPSAQPMLVLEIWRTVLGLTLLIFAAIFLTPQFVTPEGRRQTKQGNFLEQPSDPSVARLRRKDNIFSGNSSRTMIVLSFPRP